MTANAKKKRRAVRRSGVGTGTTSLLMIFTVLCFATLAMLSLSTAESNDRIQRRGILGSRQTAQAKGEAARQVALLDARLAELQQEADAEAKTAETKQKMQSLAEEYAEVFDEVKDSMEETDAPEDAEPKPKEGTVQEDVAPPTDCAPTISLERTGVHAAYFEQAAAAAETQGWRADREAGTVALYTPIDEANELVTVLQILAPGHGARYEVLQQTSQINGGWMAETGQQVWIPGGSS